MTHLLADATVRALPFAPVLQTGQSTESYLEALCLMHGISVNAMLKYLQISAPTNPHSLLDLDYTVLAHLARLCRIDAGQLEAGTLHYYRARGVAPPSSAGRGRDRRGSRIELRESGSRYCPHCLTADPTCIFTEWHLSWVFACRQHGCVLLDRCPDCGLVPRSGENRRQHRIEPWRCQRRLPGGTRSTPVTCDRDLRTATAPELSPSSPILQAQAWIDILIGTPDHPGPASVRLCGLEVPHHEALAALSFIIRRLVAGAADLDHAVVHNLGPTRKLCDRPPTISAHMTVIERLSTLTADSHLFATMTTAAVDCLSAPTLRQAGTDFERYLDLRQTHRADASDEIGHGTWRETAAARGQARRRSGLIDAIELTGRAPEMTATERICFRTQSQIPRRPAVSARVWPHTLTNEPELSGTHVPQTLWPTVMRQLPIATGKDTGAWATVAAMTLLRIGTYKRWAPIALQLALPAAFCRTPNMVLARLRDADMFDEALYVLDGLHHWLECSPPPIDYSRRRRVLSTVNDPGDDWSTACTEAGVVPTERRRRFLGFALYELVTGSDARWRREHPIPAGEQRTAYKKFRAVELGRFTDYLHEQAAQLLRQFGIAEPVAWSPHFDPDDGWYATQIGSPSLARHRNRERRTDHPDLTDSLANGGHQDAILADLVAHARTGRIIVGPQRDHDIPAPYVRESGRWTLDATGQRAEADLIHTFGPTIDLSIWDDTTTPAADESTQPAIAGTA